MRKYTTKSEIWKIDFESFSEIVQTSNSLAEIIRKCGLKASGNYKTLKSRIKKEGIDISHIALGLESNKGRKFDISPKNKLPLNEILIENSLYLGGGRNLKSRLLSEGLLLNKCYGIKCNVETIWNDSPITLQLDHINGVSDDNRIENLRLLCPNCHSQTPTFGGRNAKKMVIPRSIDLLPEP